MVIGNNYVRIKFLKKKNTQMNFVSFQPRWFKGKTWASQVKVGMIEALFAISSRMHSLGEQGQMALLGHSLAAYISVLDRERLRKLTTRIQSDTTLWLCRLFRYNSVEQPWEWMKTNGVKHGKESKRLNWCLFLIQGYQFHNTFFSFCCITICKLGKFDTFNTVEIFHKSITCIKKESRNASFFFFFF